MWKNQPIIEKERLFLRPLRINDAPEIYALRSNLEIATYLKRPMASSEQDAIYFINKINKGYLKEEWIYWGLTLKDSPKIIGTICLWNFSKKENSADIGYELLPDSQGIGLMQEAISAILYFGFTELNLSAITAVVHPDNQKSIRVLLRNNFIQKQNSKEEFFLSSSKHFQKLSE